MFVVLTVQGLFESLMKFWLFFVYRSGKFAVKRKHDRFNQKAFDQTIEQIAIRNTMAYYGI